MRNDWSFPCCFLLFDGFFQKRDWLPALALAEELVRGQPDVARLQKALIATLSNLKRYDATISQASQCIVQHGEDLTMLDALKVAYFYTGKTDEAIRRGQRALELRDAEACANPPPVTVAEPSGPPQGTNVISFSLWGAAPFYCYGAMINLKLARTVYPGWACRFYVDAAVPRPCVAYLRDNGAIKLNAAVTLALMSAMATELVLTGVRLFEAELDARVLVPFVSLMLEVGVAGGSMSYIQIMMSPCSRALRLAA